MRISDWSSDVCSSDLLSLPNYYSIGMIFYFSSCPMLRTRPQWEAWPCEAPGRNCARRSASTAMDPARCPIVPHGRGVKPFQAVSREVLYSEPCSLERKRVEKGTGVSGRVHIGGRVNSN